MRFQTTLCPGNFITIVTIFASTIVGCRTDDANGIPPGSFLNPPTVFLRAGLLKTPRGIAIDAGGDVWVADSRNDLIRRFGPNGGQKDSVVGFILPTYMGNDLSTNQILAVTSGGLIIRINPTTGAAFIEMNLIGASVDGSSVFEVNTREFRSRPIRIDRVGDIAGAPDGSIYVSVVANGEENYVIRVRNGIATALAFSNLLPPSTLDQGTRFLAVDQFGTAYTAFVIGDGSAPPAVRVFHLNTSVLSQSHVIREPFVTGGARGAGIDALAGTLFVADPPVQGMVIISTISERLIDALTMPPVSGLLQPAARDVAVGPDGSILVSVADLVSTADQAGVILKYTRVR